MPPTPAGATGATGTSSAPGGVSGPPAVRPSSSGTTMGKSKSSGSGSGKNGSNGSRSSSGGGGGGRLRGPMNAFGLLKQCGRNGFPKTLQDIALVRLASTSSKISSILSFGATICNSTFFFLSFFFFPSTCRFSIPFVCMNLRVQKPTYMNSLYFAWGLKTLCMCVCAVRLALLCTKSRLQSCALVSRKPAVPGLHST